MGGRDILTVLLPFAKAADDYEPPRHERRMRDSERVALSLTVGHLREARRMVLKLVEVKPTPDPNLIRGGVVMSEREILKALLPFAKAADDYEPPRHQRRLRDEEHVALSLTVGHLRKARRMVLILAESPELTKAS